MKKKLIRRILAVAVIATFLIGTMSFAQEYNAEISEEETEVIDAASIGIETMDHRGNVTDMVEDVSEDADIETENPVVDETPVYVEEEEDTLQEETEPVEEEDLDIPPEGMYEGYEEGVYFPINNYECEQHDGCYKCEECNLIEETGYDEEINPNGGWYLYTYCVVCGHGDCMPINESEN